MSFVTPQINDALKNHVLEEALPFGHGFLAYYMRDPGQGRMMSTLFVFTPEGIVIMGDLCPGGPGNRGSISNYNYGIGWFSRPQGEYYLCEKFMSKEWQVGVAERWCVEHLEELRAEAKEDGKPVEHLGEWEELLSQLQGEEMDCGEFQRALYDIEYDVEDEGFEYPIKAAGWLCGLQQRFVELYAALKPAAVS